MSRHDTTARPAFTFAVVVTTMTAALAGLASTAHADRGRGSPADRDGRLAVVAIQHQIRGGQSLATLHARMEARIRAAARAGAELIVFPELLAYDLVPNGDETNDAWREHLGRVARTATPRHFRAVAAWARAHRIAILGGSFPRVVGKHTFNTAILALADGRVFYQDKLFLTPEEVEWGWSPGEQLGVVAAPWGDTAILICYDSEFPQLSTLLAEHAPEVLLIPSMTGDKGLTRVRWSAQARAIEHHAYVVMTSTVPAAWNRGDYSGQAALLSPSENGFRGVIAEGTRDADEVVSGTLDLAKLRRSRVTTGIYPARDQGRRRAAIRVERAGWERIRPAARPSPARSDRGRSTIDRRRDRTPRHSP